MSQIYCHIEIEFDMLFISFEKKVFNVMLYEDEDANLFLVLRQVKVKLT